MTSAPYTPLVVTELATVAVTCRDRVTRYYGENAVAVFLDQNAVPLAVHRDDPFHALPLTGVRIPPAAPGEYKAPTPSLLAKLPAFECEPLTIYKVVNGQLKFSRNVRYSIQQLPWIIKAKGSYVIFSGSQGCPDIHGLEVGAQVTFVSPTRKNWPVSHLAPRGAWY